MDFPDPEGPDITIGGWIGVAVNLDVQLRRTLPARIVLRNSKVPEEAIMEY